MNLREKEEIIKSEYETAEILNKFFSNHNVKSIRIRSYSGPYFPTFGLNAERFNYLFIYLFIYSFIYLFNYLFINFILIWRKS